MTSPISLRRVASTVASLDLGEESAKVEVAEDNSRIYDIICDVKPFSECVKLDERMMFLVQQVKQLGEAAFWGNNCLTDCNRRHGWRLNIIAEPEAIGDEVFGFIIFKIDTEQRVLHIQYIAVSERHRRKGLGSKLIKSLQQYAIKTLTRSSVDRIVCACLPEAVDFYRKHCFRKGKKIVPTESELNGEVCSDGRIETLVPLQYSMEWKVPEKKKKPKRVHS